MAQTVCGRDERECKFQDRASLAAASTDICHFTLRGYPVQRDQPVTVCPAAEPPLPFGFRSAARKSSINVSNSRHRA